MKRNKGDPGIDGMTVEDFPAFKQEQWPRIATAIREGNYRPAPVRRAWIPKPDGTSEATPQGVPQGGPPSPLLANIALDPLDKEWECPSGLPPSSNHFPEEENADCMAGAERRQSRGHKFARYADDFIVLVKRACRNVSAADDADLAGTVTQRQILDWVELAGE